MALGVIVYLIFMSLLMVSLPFLAYFVMKYSLINYFGIVGFPNIVCSVIASVMVVNGLIAVYVYKAYHEPDDISAERLLPQEPSVKTKRSDLNLKQD